MPVFLILGPGSEKEKPINNITYLMKWKSTHFLNRKIPRLSIIYTRHENEAACGRCEESEDEIHREAVEDLFGRGTINIGSCKQEVHLTHFGILQT